jgi:pachytene checkpoint protein 2
MLPARTAEINQLRSTPIASQGLLDIRTLPNKDFEGHWNAIYVDKEIKDRLLNQAILNFSVRPYVNRAMIPLHGIILMVGVPGTGKTSQAKGLADRVAQALQGGITYLEVEPHSLSSSSHGKSQKAVTELFSTTIAEHASKGPTIVLLDEVETLFIDRSKLSMDANPIDVHRATDAALVQLDHLAEKFTNLLFVATSNFSQAIDNAFSSRCDLVLEIPPPNGDAIRAILESSLKELAKKFTKISKLLEDPELESVVQALKGLDGRQLRKAVVSACSFQKKTAADPNHLTIHDLVRAAKSAKKEKL